MSRKVIYGINSSSPNKSLVFYEGDEALLRQFQSEELALYKKYRIELNKRSISSDFYYDIVKCLSRDYDRDSIDDFLKEATFTEDEQFVTVSYANGGTDKFHKVSKINLVHESQI